MSSGSKSVKSASISSTVMSRRRPPSRRPSPRACVARGCTAPRHLVRLDGDRLERLAAEGYAVEAALEPRNRAPTYQLSDHPPLARFRLWILPEATANTIATQRCW